MFSKLTWNNYSESYKKFHATYMLLSCEIAECVLYPVISVIVNVSKTNFLKIDVDLWKCYTKFSIRIFPQKKTRNLNIRTFFIFSHNKILESRALNLHVFLIQGNKDKQFELSANWSTGKLYRVYNFCGMTSYLITETWKM